MPDKPINIYLPYRAEFGWIVMAHVPAVAADSGRKWVIHEPGLDSLYPGCERHLPCRVRPDHERRRWVEPDFIELERQVCETTYQASGPFEYVRPCDRIGEVPLKYFTPEPVTNYPDIRPDVVICPRKRSYGDKKNWPHWRDLAAILTGDGFDVFAAGAPDSSITDIGVSAAWDKFVPLDATLSAFASAALVIATDAGLAHLAVLCGRPLLLICHSSGHTAPGYDPVDWSRYKRANHRRSLIQTCPCSWGSAEPVATAARRIIGRVKHG